MRKFADLHIKLQNLSDDVLTRTGQTAREMGIDILGVVLPRDFDQYDFSKVKNNLARTGIDAATRIDLNQKSRSQLLSDLRSVRKKFEIVAVECRSPTIARIACRDRRVDIVSFPIENQRIKFSSSLGGLCKGSLEVDIAPLLSTKELPRHILLSRLRDRVSTAKRSRVPIILSSGAENPLMLRAPREIAAIGALLGLENVEALDSVSKTPLTILERNREKLSTVYVAKGVRVAEARQKVA